MLSVEEPCDILGPKMGNKRQRKNDSVTVYFVAIYSVGPRSNLCLYLLGNSIR